MARKVLAVKNDTELLSYIINVTPELRDNIDLPVQGESIAPIGKIIVNNERYKNAFINTVNLIGLTLIKRNAWDNPWNFTLRGTLNFGQQVREMILDLCKVFDYNQNFDNKAEFLNTEVPNVFQYIHEVNFQKYYKTTTSDAQLAMAFTEEGKLLDFITEAISMLYESMKYDTYIVDKYMLCRRILDGTMTPVQIADYDTLTPRQRVSALKSVSNKMTFRSPNYNPAVIRRATSFDDQILIVNTEFEADFSTDVLATSYFRDEADMRARLALIDSFSEHDDERLKEVLLTAYIPFTTDEKQELAKIPAVLISKEWFMDYIYALNTESGMKQTEFYNPQTLENNHFLHVWKVFSTSPFENGAVFTPTAGAVTGVTVTPATATVTAGQNLQMQATVATTGFVNQAVQWSLGADDENASINSKGVLTINSAHAAGSITVKATSIYDSTKSGTATITVVAQSGE